MCFFILDIFSAIKEFPVFGFSCFPDLPVCLPLTLPFGESPLSHWGNPAAAELFLRQHLPAHREPWSGMRGRDSDVYIYCCIFTEVGKQTASTGPESCMAGLKQPLAWYYHKKSELWKEEIDVNLHLFPLKGSFLNASHVLFCTWAAFAISKHSLSMLVSGLTLGPKFSLPSSSGVWNIFSFIQKQTQSNSLWCVKSELMKRLN